MSGEYKRWIGEQVVFQYKEKQIQLTLDENSHLRDGATSFVFQLNFEDNHQKISVALKIPRDGFSVDKELEILGKISHQNSGNNIPWFNVAKIGDTQGFVMEYLPNEYSWVFLRTNEIFSEAKKLEAAYQVFNVMHTALELGYANTDFKIENLFWIPEQNRAVVLDWNQYSRRDGTEQEKAQYQNAFHDIYVAILDYAYQTISGELTPRPLPIIDAFEPIVWQQSPRFLRRLMTMVRKEKLNFELIQNLFTKELIWYQQKEQQEWDSLLISAEEAVENGFIDLALDLLTIIPAEGMSIEFIERRRKLDSQVRSSNKQSTDQLEISFQKAKKFFIDRQFSDIKDLFNQTYIDYPDDHRQLWRFAKLVSCAEVEEKRNKVEFIDQKKDAEFLDGVGLENFPGGLRSNSFGQTLALFQEADTIIENLNHRDLSPTERLRSYENYLEWKKKNKGDDSEVQLSDKVWIILEECIPLYDLEILKRDQEYFAHNLRLRETIANWKEQLRICLQDEKNFEKFGEMLNEKPDGWNQDYDLVNIDYVHRSWFKVGQWREAYSYICDVEQYSPINSSLWKSYSEIVLQMLLHQISQYYHQTLFKDDIFWLSAVVDLLPEKVLMSEDLIRLKERIEIIRYVNKDDEPSIQHCLDNNVEPWLSKDGVGYSAKSYLDFLKVEKITKEVQEMIATTTGSEPENTIKMLSDQLDTLNEQNEKLRMQIDTAGRLVHDQRAISEAFNTALANNQNSLNLLDKIKELTEVRDWVKNRLEQAEKIGLEFQEIKKENIIPGLDNAHLLKLLNMLGKEQFSEALNYSQGIPSLEDWSSQLLEINQDPIKLSLYKKWWQALQNKPSLDSVSEECLQNANSDMGKPLYEFLAARHELLIASELKKQDNKWHEMFTNKQFDLLVNELQPFLATKSDNPNRRLAQKWAYKIQLIFGLESLHKMEKDRNFFEIYKQLDPIFTVLIPQELWELSCTPEDSKEE